MEVRQTSAGLDVDIDIMPERWPVIFLSDQLPSLVDSEVACQRIVMVSADKLGSDDLRYVKESYLGAALPRCLPSHLSGFVP